MVAGNRSTAVAIFAIALFGLVALISAASVTPLCTIAALSSAISSAASGDVISMSSCAPQTTLLLTAASSFRITKSLVIDGANALTINGGGVSRVFIVGTATTGSFTASGVSVNLTNLKIINGYASNEVSTMLAGGCIAVGSQGKLTITNSVIDHCWTDMTAPATAAVPTYEGGAVYMGTQSFLTVVNATIKNGTSYYGGGIYASNGTTVSVTDSFIDGNTATWGGGIFLKSFALNATKLKVTNCVFRWNSATVGTGGGALVEQRCVGEFYRSTFIANKAYEFGGGIGYYYINFGTIDNCLFLNNTITGPYDNARGRGGGGLFLSESIVSVTNCEFAFNVGGLGGGLRNLLSNTFIDNCVFYANKALTNYAPDSICGFGGGMQNDGLMMINQPAPFDVPARMTIQNTAFDANECYGAGCGLYLCVYNRTTLGDDIATLKNLTVCGNTLRGNWSARYSVAAGLYFGCDGTAYLSSTILGGNSQETPLSAGYNQWTSIFNGLKTAITGLHIASDTNVSTTNPDGPLCAYSWRGTSGSSLIVPPTVIPVPTAKISSPPVVKPFPSPTLPSPVVKNPSPAIAYPSPAIIVKTPSPAIAYPTPAAVSKPPAMYPSPTKVPSPPVVSPPPVVVPPPPPVVVAPPPLAVSPPNLPSSAVTAPMPSSDTFPSSAFVSPPPPAIDSPSVVDVSPDITPSLPAPVPVVDSPLADVPPPAPAVDSPSGVYVSAVDSPSNVNPAPIVIAPSTPSVVNVGPPAISTPDDNVNSTPASVDYLPYEIGVPIAAVVIALLIAAIVLLVRKYQRDHTSHF